MLHEGAGPGALRLVRAGVFGVWAVVVADTRLDLAHHLPLWMFDAPGVLKLVPDSGWEVLIEPGFLGLSRYLLLLVLLFAAFLPRPPRALLLVSAIGLVVFHGAVLGWEGFLSHVRMAPLHVAIFLSLVDHRGIRERPEMAGATLRLAALVLSLSYLLIGAHRLLAGGLEIFLGDALSTYMAVRTFEPGSSAFNLSFRLLRASWLLPLLNIGFLVTTVAEVLTPLAVFNRTIRWAWLATIVSFHFATLFTMNIFFWENLILILLLFTALPGRAEGWRLRRSAPAEGVPVAPA